LITSGTIFTSPFPNSFCDTENVDLSTKAEQGAQGRLNNIADVRIPALASEDDSAIPDYFPSEFHVADALIGTAAERTRCNNI